MTGIKEIIISRSEEIKDEVIKLRRHFHRYPELSFEENNTSEFICRWLEANGIRYINGIAGTGIVATINGLSDKGRTIALRAEMDALPILEKNQCDYSSTIPGIMHACGHDGHMAMLMGTAIILNNLKTQFEGTVLLIFQPGEEKSPGGAKLLIETGVFNDLKPDMFISQHDLPELETGKVGYRSGIYMASCDEIYITVIGKGGHAALPGMSTDQIYIASKLVVELKERMARQVSLNQIPTVLGIGRIIGEGATNVIPEKVEIAGTFRTFDEKWRAEGIGLVRSIAEEVASGSGVKTDVRIAEGYPVLFNDEKLTEKAIAFSEELLGKDSIETFDLRMSSDDFSFYNALAPCLYYRVGIKGKNSPMRKLHTPDFDIDEEALKTGVANLSWLVYRFLTD